LKIKLHTKIIIGLIAGTIFGAVFSVSIHKIEIKTVSESFTIDNWEKISFYSNDSLLRSFGKSEQAFIIKNFSQYKNFPSLSIIINYPDGIEQRIDNPAQIEKVKTLPVLLKPLGEIFIRLLMMIAVPLVLASLIAGVAALSDLKSVARIGGKTIGFYFLTGVFAVTTGLLCANIIQPGNFMPPENREMLIQAYQSDAQSRIDQGISLDIIDFIVNIIPRNPFQAIAEGNYLSIVFFAIIIGLFLAQIKDEKARIVIGFFEGLGKALILLVEKIMLIAPYAVFILIAATVAEFGFNILQTLFFYIMTVVIGLSILTFIEYPVYLKIFTKIKVRDFFRAVRPVMAVAFSTSSSAATLPVNMEVTEKKLGVPNRIASFVLPLGTTINMDGTALYQAVAAVFIAQVYGFDLTITQQLTIVLTASLASIGTAPVPGIGLIMLLIVLRSIGVPAEGLALIIGVDRIVDMCRTVPNVVADSLASVVIASSEGQLREINLKEEIR
jgi:proton glutamate symport protein